MYYTNALSITMTSLRSLLPGKGTNRGTHPKHWLTND